MDVGGLAVFVLQDVGEAAVQHAGLAVAERGGVLAERGAAAAGFDADQFHGFVVDERGENPGRVAARRRRRRSRNRAAWPSISRHCARASVPIID